MIECEPCGNVIAAEDDREAEQQRDAQPAGNRKRPVVDVTAISFEKEACR
jgi:hypothetical protein